MPAKRARQAYVDYDKIQPLIDAQKLDAYDIVFSKDRSAFYIIGESLDIKPVKSRLDVYDDLSQALIAVNSNSDTYVGQIVLVLTQDDGYKPYVVNKDASNPSYRLVAVNSGHIVGTVKYDDVENVPIQNIVGTTEIILSDLPDGNYAVMGNYRIDGNDPTHRMTSKKIMYYIETDDTDPTKKFITEVKGGSVKFYTCTSAAFAEDQYVLLSEVNAKVATYLDDNLDGYVDDYVNDNTASTEDVEHLFD